MPTYIYKRTDNGERVSVVMPISHMERRQREALESNGVEAGILLVREDGIDEDGPVVATRDFAAEFNRRDYRAGSAWPQVSDAAGVGVHQIDEARDHSIKIGIPTDFDSEGRAIFTSRGHRKRYCRAVGLRDNQGGYGDP